MASRGSGQERAIAAAMDADAILSDGREAVRSLELLVRTITRAHLWHELAWEPEQAEADALRDVARVRRALEVGAARVGGEE